MYSHNRIFSDKYLDAKAAGLEIPEIDKKLAIIAEWQKGIVSGRIARSKEEQLQSDFLQRFFGDVLEYSYSKGLQQWHLDEEQKTLIDASKMDGAMGFFSIEDAGNIISDIRVVIELKDARTDLDSPQHRKNDKRTPVQQAFDYANAVGGTCRWVIVSDFIEIRLYFHNDRSRYESFDIRHLDRPEQFARFWLLLHRQRLIAEKHESFTDKLYYERQQIEATISKQFYNEYKQSRLNLFHHLKAENPSIDELTLLSKTQKLLDRILFVCFCEDVGIIPPYVLRNMIDLSIGDRLIRSDVKLYPRLRALFDAVNKGFPEENINKFNGGLFAEDEILNHLIIKDSVIIQIASLKQYDFASDLNVNILGHIFEQSVSDIEELKAEIAGHPFDKKNGKRKKEGIYYTPEYITRYIVEQAVGGWLADRKAEIGLDTLPELSEQDYQSVKIVKQRLKANETVKMHIQAFEAYREKLKNIKVLDPACGSGAFLNQVFDFLYKEGQKVNRILAKLKGGQHEVGDLDKDILSNNIFGVDLNIESVEITKLSLWLKTANQSKELTTLDNNIRCGNSLIDDPAVAGEKAFDWNRKFPEIMAKGGFDVVVGNPPYVTIFPEKNYFKQCYQTAQYQLDLYVLFIEKAVRLLKNDGFISFITPNSWLKNLMMTECRLFMLKYLQFKTISPYLSDVFSDASVDNLVFNAIKTDKEKTSLNIASYEKGSIEVKRSIDQNRFLLNKNFVFDVEVSDEIQSVIGKMSNNTISISELFEITRGMNPYDIYTGQSEEVIRNKVYHASYKKDDTFVPELRGKHVNRYGYEWDGCHFISYGNWLAAPRDEKFFKGNRIVFREVLGERFVCTLISEDMKIDRSLYIALPIDDRIDIKYVLSLLASTLYAFCFRYKNNEFDKLFPKIRVAEFKSLPIKIIDKESQKPFIDKADIMLSQNKALSALRNDFLNFIKNELKPQKISTKLENWHDLDWDGFKKELAKGKVKLDTLSLKDRKEWQDYFLEYRAKALDIKAIIDKTDRKIDRMVYALYGLTDEEIRIVEGEK